MWQKIEFYITSLFFLFFLLFITHLPVCFKLDCEVISFGSLLTENLIICICAILMFLGVIFFFRFKYKFEDGLALLPIEVKEITNINFESVTFLATYIIPLACIDLDKDRSSLMLIVILILIGWIYIKTDLFYTNPTLAIWGYHVYKISSVIQKDIIIISRKKIQINESIYIKKIDQKIYMVKP